MTIFVLKKSFHAKPSGEKLTLSVELSADMTICQSYNILSNNVEKQTIQWTNLSNNSMSKWHISRIAIWHLKMTVKTKKTIQKLYFKTQYFHVRPPEENVNSTVT